MRIASLPLLLFPILLSACTTRPGQESSMRILQGYDPEFVTVREEQAKLRAMQSGGKLALSPGRYCTGFITTKNDQDVTGRLELTIASENRFLLGMRYQAGSTVWSRSQGGVYALRGHTLSLLSAGGNEINLPLNTITGNSIDVWGDLPMTRDMCNGEPLQGGALASALDKANEQQESEFPWPLPAAAPTTPATR